MVEILIKILKFLRTKNFPYIEKTVSLLTFLIELFGGDTQVVIKNTQNFINEIAKKVEGIDIDVKMFCKNKLDVDLKFIAENSNECFPDFKITDTMFEEINKLQMLNYSIMYGADSLERELDKKKKSLVKMDLAFEMAIQHAKEHKIEYTIQGVKLVIECAVSRYFTKAIK